jgi:hypothetical protein
LDTFSSISYLKHPPVYFADHLGGLRLRNSGFFAAKTDSRSSSKETPDISPIRFSPGELAAPSGSLIDQALRFHFLISL